jgi:cyclase
MDIRKKIRIIPRLDIKGPNLVKGIHLEGLRVLGKPEKFAKYYYENGADELFFQDTVASLYDRNSLHEIISLTAKEIFIPLTVGGGIRNVEDIKYILRSGADKVSINTEAIKRPNFIKEASLQFGSSTIVVAIEAIKDRDGIYRAYTDNGREITGKNVLDWAQEAEFLGAGEILITSVDNEGTFNGYNYELIELIDKAVSIPIIAHGGCSSFDDIEKIVTNTKCDAFCISSILHYKIARELQENEKYEGEGNVNFLFSSSNFNNIQTTKISDIKSSLKNIKIPVRS